jgi:hypothetical protein
LGRRRMRRAAISHRRDPPRIKKSMSGGRRR